MAITPLPALDRTSATFKTDLDDFFLTDLPTFSTEAEAARVAIVASQAAAAASAATAVAIAETSLAASNYKGAWSGLTGALNKPASVSHAGTFWVLTTNLANVTTDTPGVSANWVPVIMGSIPQDSQSAAYTFALTDAGKHILHPSADTTARVFTIPANSSVAFPIGTVLTIINQNAAGVITLSITSDTMRWAPSGTTGSRSLSANGVATVVKLTATEWILNGVGLS